MFTFAWFIEYQQPQLSTGSSAVHVVNNSTVLNDEADAPQQKTTHEWDMALFLMRATSELDLTHAGIERLCHSTQWLMEMAANRAVENVKSYSACIITDFH